MSKKTVDLTDCVCLKETEKAILVSIPDVDDDMWIPLSQIDDDSEVYQEGDEGTLIISEWIALQKGLL